MVAKKRYFLFTLCLMAGSGCICITFASMEFSYLVGDDFRLLQVSLFYPIGSLVFLKCMENVIEW